MTRAVQVLLARAMGVPDGEPLPAYVQGRSAEIDILLRESRLPAGHPVVQAHAAGIAMDWRAQEAAQALGQAALALYGATGQNAPSPPPGSPRGACSRAVWRLLSTAMTGTPDAERLPASVLARAGELDRVLREARLPANHPDVLAHAARIVVDSRVQEAAGLAQQASAMFRAWRAETKRRHDELVHREQAVESKEATLDQRLAELETREVAVVERERVLHAREASLELRDKSTRPAVPGLWMRFKTWFMAR